MPRERTRKAISDSLAFFSFGTTTEVVMSRDYSAIKERIYKYSKPNGECIETLYKSGWRYKMAKFGKRIMGVHRIAWIIHHGEIPKGMWVCHHCDNPKCININHLFLGSPQDNTDDMKRKKRQDYWGRQKYSDEIADKAIKMRQEGYSYREIGKELNIEISTVNSFFRRTSTKEKVKSFYAIPKYPKEIVDRAWYLRRLGVQCKVIEKELGIPKRSLSRIFKGFVENI